MEPFIPSTFDVGAYVTVTLLNHIYLEGRLTEKATLGISVEQIEEDITFIPWAAIAHLNVIDDMQFNLDDVEDDDD